MVAESRAGQQRQSPARSPTSPTACSPPSASLAVVATAMDCLLFSTAPPANQALAASGDEWIPVAMHCVTPSPEAEGNQVAVTPTAVIRPKLPTPFRFSHTFGPVHGKLWLGTNKPVSLLSQSAHTYRRVYSSLQRPIRLPSRAS